MTRFRMTLILFSLWWAACGEEPPAPPAAPPELTALAEAVAAHGRDPSAATPALVRALRDVEAAEQRAEVVTLEGALNRGLDEVNGTVRWTVSSDRTRIAGITEDGWVIWDAREGRVLHRSEPAPDPSTPASHVLSADGSTLVEQRAGLTRVIDVASGRVRRTLRGVADDHLREMAIASDGSRLAVGASQAPLQLWDLVRGVKIADLAEAQTSGGMRFLRPDRFLGAGPPGGAQALWDATSGNRIARFEAWSGRPIGGAHFLVDRVGDEERGREVRRIEDGRLVASITGFGLTNGPMLVDHAPGARILVQVGRRLEVHDATSWRVLATVPLGAEDYPAAVTSDGTVLAVNRNGGIGALLAVPSGREIARLAGAFAGFTADGTHVVVRAPDGIRIASTSAGTERARIAVTETASAAVYPAPEGARLLVTDRDGRAWLWDAGHPDRARWLLGHREAITAVEWLPAGRLVTGDAGTLRLWNPAHHARRIVRLRRVPSTNRLAFTGDGRLLISVHGLEGWFRPSDPSEIAHGGESFRWDAATLAAQSDDRPLVRLDDRWLLTTHVESDYHQTVGVRGVANGAVLGRMHRVGGTSSILLSADGRRALLWFERGGFEFGHVDRPIPPRHRLEVREVASDRTLSTPWDGAEPFGAAAISPDGAWVLLGAREGGRTVDELRVVRADGGEVAGRAPLGSIWGITVAPDNTCAAVYASGGHTLHELPSARVRAVLDPPEPGFPDSETELPAPLRRIGRPGEAWFTADSAIVLTVSPSSPPRLARVADGTPIGSPVGRFVGEALTGERPRFAALVENHLVIWDARNGAELGRIPLAGTAHVVPSPTLEHVAVVGAHGAVTLRVAEAGRTVATLDAGAPAADAIWSGDGTLLATLERDAPLAWVWGPDGRLRAGVCAEEQPIRAITFDPPRGRIAVAAPEGIRVFPLDPADLVAAACDHLRARQGRTGIARACSSAR